MTQKLELTTANGNSKMIDFETGFTLKALAKPEEKTRAIEVSYALTSAYESISKGYTEICPWLARAISEKTHTAFVGVNSPNSLLIGLTGCSKSWASELVKIVKTFYTSDGNIINGFGLFTFTELKKLAGFDEEKREELRLLVVDSGVNTREEAAKLFSGWKKEQLEKKEEEEVVETTSEEVNVENEPESSSDELETSNEELAGEPDDGFEDITKLSKNMTSLLNELRKLTTAKTTVSGIKNRLLELIEEYSA